MSGPAPTDGKTTSVRLTTEDYEFVQRRAKQLDVSMGWVIRAAVKAERAAVELEEASA